MSRIFSLNKQQKMVKNHSTCTERKKYASGDTIPTFFCKADICDLSYTVYVVADMMIVRH